MFSDVPSRRTHLLLLLGCCVSHQIVSGTSLSAEGKQLTLVIDRPVTTPVRLAVTELRRVLGKRQISVAESDTIPATKQPVFVIGIANRSLTLDRMLQDRSLSVPRPEESLLLKRVRDESRPTVLAAGRDVRGLTYAILELARTIELTPTEKDWFSAIPEIAESPWLRTRSITMQLVNEDLDGRWYFDEDFWRSYFAMLARCRYNNFSLTFAHQTNYMNPAYPWLLKIPEYPAVRVEGLLDRARVRNLDMLRRISELAHEYAIDFTFGASEWRFWPEMNPGGPLSAYAAIQPSDYGQFYAIRSWRRVEGWMSEDWHGGHSGFVEDAIKDRVQAKWTPIQVSRQLYQLADQTEHALEAARRQISSRNGGQTDRVPGEFAATELDLRVLAKHELISSSQTDHPPLANCFTLHCSLFTVHYFTAHRS